MDKVLIPECLTMYEKHIIQAHLIPRATLIFKMLQNKPSFIRFNNIYSLQTIPNGHLRKSVQSDFK